MSNNSSGVLARPIRRPVEYARAACYLNEAAPSLWYAELMAPFSYPLQFFVVALAGWINQQQRDVIDYLRPRIACSTSRSARDGYDSRTISAFAWPPRRRTYSGECSGRSEPS